MENNCLNLMNILKMILISAKIFREKSSEFHNLEKRINPNNLTDNYKTEGMSPIYFSN